MKSKHIAAIALSAMMIFGLVGCGGTDSNGGKNSGSSVPEGMSQAFYDAGVKFVGVLDSTIDMDLEPTEAAEKGRVYADAMKEELESDEMQKALEEASVGAETEKLIMEGYALSAGTICTHLEYMDWADEFDVSELLEQRNDFADDFGIDDRSY